MMTEQQHAGDADQQNSDDAIERLRSKPRRPPGPEPRAEQAAAEQVDDN
jgi:hypothetical protein